MALPKQYSVLGGTMVAVLVYGVYQGALPSAADTRTVDVNNADIARSERTASWISAAAVTGISLIAQDPTIFIIGGTMVIGMAWMHRHANWVNPLTGKVGPSDAATPKVGQAAAPEEYSAPETPQYASVI